MDRYTFDQEYVRRLTDGDPDVERHFTSYFNDLLLLKLRTRLRSPQLAEDARQETFLRVFTTLRQKNGLEHPERLGAFVNSVCNNVLFEFFRSSARSQPLPEDRNDPPDPAAGPESELVTKERKLQVKEVLATLPAKDRELLKSIFWEEKDNSEVCRQLGVDREYLRVLLHRAKARFRERFVKQKTA
ncbi:MAG: RNA polymerase sigma factor [Bryobacteraceae bacterium]